MRLQSKYRENNGQKYRENHESTVLHKSMLEYFLKGVVRVIKCYRKIKKNKYLLDIWCRGPSLSRKTKLTNSDHIAVFQKKDDMLGNSNKGSAISFKILNYSFHSNVRQNCLHSNVRRNCLHGKESIPRVLTSGSAFTIIVYMP